MTVTQMETVEQGSGQRTDAPPLGALVQHGTRPARWLGLDPTDPTGATGMVLVGGYVAYPRVRDGFPRCESDEPSSPAEAIHGLIAALQDAHTRADAVTERLDQIVSDAHEWANDHDLCRVFDQFCERHDLPTRVREYEVSIVVTGTVEASSLENAEDAVDSEWVNDHINWDSIEVTEP